MADGDLPFCEHLYVANRWEELSVTDWPDAAKTAFLAQQHQAQHLHYRTHYPGADWLIVEQDGVAVGRLYRVVWPDEIRVIDITLLHQARGKGIGTALLGAIIEEARSLGKAVTIHVEKNNPARSLYARLGFAVVEDKGVYDLWRRAPGS